MRGQLLGSLIGAVFGLIYVLVNAGLLPAVVGAPVRLLGAAAFLAVVVAVVVAVVREPVASGADGPQAPPGRVFGTAYWLVVAGEVVALFGGLAVVNVVFAAPRAGVGWVSVVVGVHFFALAVVFGQRFFHRLGVVITLCGVAGLALAATGAGAASIAGIAGVVPGAVLLGFGWWGARRRAATMAPR